MRRYRSPSRPRQYSSWRRLKSQFKLKKFFHRVSLALIVVVAVFLTLGAIYVWKFFAEPFASAASSFQKTSWDGESPFNLLWIEVARIDASSPQTQNISVAAFNPTQGTFTVITLPIDYQNLKDLYGSGELSENRDGIGKVAHEVSRLLGVPIDGYVLVGERSLADLHQIFPTARDFKDYFSLGSIFRLPSVWQVAREDFRTSLSFTEILHAFWYVAQVRSDRVDSISLSSALLDDPPTLDGQLSPLLRDEKLFQEHLRIQVLNGSGKSGQAAQAARIIENLGGEVIRADNFERQDLVRGYLLLDSSGSYTARRLAQIFNVFDSRPPRTGAESRADITLVLGAENSK